MTGLTVNKNAKQIRRMNLNESPYPVPESVLAAMVEAVALAGRYPDALTAPLLAALADYIGIEVDRIFIGCGSNEILHILPLIANALRPEDEIVIPDPSFPTYAKVAGHFGFTPKLIPVRPSGAADVDAILAAITPQTKLVCVPTPNNPTGAPLTAAELEQLVLGVPETVLLHIDEAYYEFGIEAGGKDTLPIISKRARNWITTRSFSKAFGLAGLRLGYGIAADAELAVHANSRRANFSANAIALTAGRASLAEIDVMQKNVASVAAERDRIARGLKALGLEPLPSAANFVSFPVPDGIAPLAPALKEQGILVTAFNLPGAKPAIRISVGLADDSDAVLEALGTLVKT